MSDLRCCYFLLISLVLTFVILLIIPMKSKDEVKPNIVIIIADDLGSYDVSFRGSNQFVTPNIDALAFNGVIFDRFYTPPLCTPSRSSIMTGKNPHSIGMQHYVIPSVEPWGLGLEQKLLSNYFKDAGYSTHLVGKWHLGFFEKLYTPTFRGFDTFFGYYNGMIDYFKFTYLEPAANFTPGYDLHMNEKIYRDVKNESYATNLFTEAAVDIIRQSDKSNPFLLVLSQLAAHSGNEYDLLQAPSDDIERFDYIADPERRKLAAMVSNLDKSVGCVVEALEQKGILENSVIFFLSDNGAPSVGFLNNAGSNYPLKGQKYSPWEGASRNLGFIYSPLITQSKRIEKGYFHTSDILPTLASSAKIEVQNVDGFDHWKNLVNGETLDRNEVVIVNDKIDNYFAFIKNEWKFVDGTKFPDLDHHFGKIQEYEIVNENYIENVQNSKVGKILKNLSTNEIFNMRKQLKIRCSQHRTKETEKCEPKKFPCLFNIHEDPCERHNLAAKYPQILSKMSQNLEIIKSSAVTSRRVPTFDIRSDPERHSGTWTWWMEK